MIIAPEYQAQLVAMHNQGRFVRGSKMLDVMRPVIEQYQPASILDFGCGHGALIDGTRQACPHIHVDGYDPGNHQYSQVPEQSFDMIVSNDVFEHIEPEYLSTTLQLINNKMNMVGWFRIACYPAKKTLPDGRNAHLIVELPEWWRDQLLENMNVEFVSETITEFDRTDKWPEVKGCIYDVVVKKVK